MANILQGVTDAASGSYGVVVSRYNHSITAKLLDGALQTLAEAGVADEEVDVAWVPGAWEIPVVAQRLAASGRYAAVLCLGAVIRGETTHDQYINLQVSVSLGQLAVATGVPVLFGLLSGGLWSCANLVGDPSDATPDDSPGQASAEASAEPPRKTTALPDLMQSAAASTVTLGRDS